MDSASIEISNRLDQVKAKVRRRGRLSHHDADLTGHDAIDGGQQTPGAKRGGSHQAVNDTVLPALQRVDGVSCHSLGPGGQQLKITLDQGQNRRAER